MRVAGRGYRDGVRNLEVMVESLSSGSKPEIQLSRKWEMYGAGKFFV